MAEDQVVNGRGPHSELWRTEYRIVEDRIVNCGGPSSEWRRTE